jgi:peptidoglycan hydrolase-like protein with peptidoglycan-binding domain
VRLWSAHYGGPHVCGPRPSCGALSVTADGTQWTSAAMGRVLDQSLLLDNFFGTIPDTPGQNWTETIMQQLPELRQGATGTFVRTAQFQCGERGHKVAVDGSFGNLTRQAVIASQRAAGVNPDGVVGPVTWSALLGVQ